MGPRGVAADLAARLEVAEYAALGGDDAAVADFDMPLEARLPTDDAPAADARTAGDARLGRDQAVLADLHTVGHLHQVVDARAPADDRGVEGRAVDAAVRADHDIVLDHDP